MFASSKTQQMNFEKNAGIALLIGSFLMTVTMLLHPAGGNFEHLLSQTTIIIVTHVIAIAAMPVCSVGFHGLTRQLGSQSLLPVLGRAFSTFALIAGMLAGAINGLALPIYINRFKDADVATIEQIKPILKYGSALNHAFDYILIGGICMSVLLWSVEMIKQKKPSVNLGYFGILLTAAAVVMLVSGFAFTSLYGFRVFIFGLVGWLVWCGWCLIKVQKSFAIKN
jgi:hypothetical protein